MFENIGHKIKSFAAIVTAIGIIISIIAGVFAGITFQNFIVALLIIIIGGIISYISTFILYGFGELIHRTENIEKYMYIIMQQNNSTNSNPASDNTATTPEQKPPLLTPQQENISSVPLNSMFEGCCDSCSKQTFLVRCKVPKLPYTYSLCAECIKKHKAIPKK